VRFRPRFLNPLQFSRGAVVVVAVVPDLTVR
jgi:hypothetical protein